MFSLSTLSNKETLVVFLTILLILPDKSASISTVASFSQRGVTGTITFTQPSISSPTSISLSLTGLDQLSNEQYQWHIHQYPFSGALATPCSPMNVGGHYDPFGANAKPNYIYNCQQNVSFCEVGDLSGKFGLLNSTTVLFNTTDPHLDLYGQYSIIGRSVVLHTGNGSRYVCANIRYPQEENAIISYVPLRGGRIGGNIRIVQYSGNATSVYSKLFSTAMASSDHNWHVHSNPVSSGDTSCLSAGGHYNPREVDTTGNYSLLCRGSSPLECEVGDLSGKGGRLNFLNNLGTSLYTDTDLPISIYDGVSITNRSIVIHAANAGAKRVVCGNIISTNSRQAIATFNGEEGINGFIRFKQASPFGETKVSVSLSGLSGIADGYHIHETPVGERIQGRERCSAKYTGLHWNPRGVVYGNNARVTSDQYEIGDLSGKFGSLTGNGSYNEEFTDMNIPLFGQDSIIGRSVVIHFGNSSRWVCANILYDMPTVEASAMLNVSGNMIRFGFVQLASDPYADTTITIQKVLSASLMNTSSSSSSVTSQSTSSRLVTVFSSSSSSRASQTISQSVIASTTTTTTSASVSSSPSSSSSSTPSTVPSSSLSSSSSIVPTYASSPSVSSPSSLSSILSSSSSSISTSLSAPASSIIQSSSSTQSSFVSLSSSTSSSPSLASSPSPGSGIMFRRRRGTNFDLFKQFDEEVAVLYDPESESEFMDSHDTYMYDDMHEIKKRATTQICWSIKKSNGGQQLLAECGSLEEFLQPIMDSVSLCESGEKLACSAGDLTEKHGMIEVDSETGVRAVFTDPYLPLSGPESALGNVLLIESGDSSQYVMISSEDSQQEPVTCIATNSPSTSSSSSLSSSSSATSAIPAQTSSSNLPLPLSVLIPVCVGGLLTLIIFVVVVVVIILCCAKRRDRYKFDKCKTSKSSGVELGMYKRVNPVFGVATYKVLYDYTPREDGDLELHENEIVTLIEAPAGGDWWRGRVGDKEGWFPKSYVNYVDMQAEEKKKKEAEIDRVEAVIRAYTLAGSRTSAIEVDSTPRLVTKFNGPIKEEEEETAVTSNHLQLPNTPPESNPGTPLLDDRNMIPISPHVVESPISSPVPSSSQSPLPGYDSATTNSQSPAPSSDSPVPDDDIFIAKHNLIPDSESELQLTAGQRVVIIERADNGWWHGVIGESHGWIPETFLSPLKKEENGNRREASQETKDETPFRPRGMTEFHSGSSDEVNASEYKALSEYMSETEGDLSFYEGDVVLVYWANQNGWWFGAAGSAQGWFPGSYVEPILEEPSPTSAANTTSEADLRTPTVDTPLPVNLGHVVSAASKQKEEGQQTGLEQQQQNITLSSHAGGGGSLADDIAAALKKKGERKKTKSKEESSTSKDVAGGVGGDITATQEKSHDNQDSSVEKTPLTREREDSVERLGDDIMSMITCMATEENLAKEPSPAMNADHNKRHPHRKAPPPPAAVGQTGGNRKSKARDKQQPQGIGSNEVSLPQLVSPPPPPSPATLSVSEEKPISTKNETKPDATSQAGSKEISSRPASPGSAPNRRRRPPSPPSPLASHSISNPPATPSSLVTHTISADVNPTSPVNVNESHLPVLGKSLSLLPNKADKLRTNASVQRNNTPSSWKPQSRGSTWKPQTKNGKKEFAPRREPPKPPSLKNSSPRVKVQKVKRPGKNIPPPPSIPLPPPPPLSSNTSKLAPPASQLPPPPAKKHKTTSGPPPIKKVLSGPPPVKQVLSGPPPVKKVLTSPTSPSPPQLESSFPFKTAIPVQKAAIVGNDADTKTPRPPVVDSTAPPPVITESLNTLETKLHVPKKEKSDNTKKQSELPTDNTESTLLNLNNGVPKTTTTHTSLKPKTKPAVRPKPRKLEKVVIESPSSSNAEGLSAKPQSTPEGPAQKPRPKPPERTSSLPSTPDTSPCPSPVIPRTQVSPLVSPTSGSGSVKSALQKPPSPKSTEETDSKSSEVHEASKLASKSVPPKPAPPKSTKETIDSESSVQTEPLLASNGDRDSDNEEEQMPKPVNITRRDSKSVPPRPAPPRTIKPTEKTNAPQPRPRKISEPHVRVQNSMDSMKQLEARPQRGHPTPNSQDPAESIDGNSPETSVEARPVPKRRTSQSDQETTPIINASIPSHPPPPATTKRVSKIGSENSSEPLSDGPMLEETNSNEL